MQRRYRADKIVNFRDLGGYPFDGGVTRYGRALRCGVPNGTAQSDIELVRSLGIRRIFDLRGENEVIDLPSGLYDIPGVECVNIPLLEVNPDTSKNQSVTDMYIYSLTENAPNYAKVLRLIAETDAPFMFHCFGGKDRTGLLAALLLGAAGVEREDIVADYQISFTYLRPFYEREIAAGSSLIWETDLTRLESSPDKMCSTLDFLDGNYGGIMGYISSLGLTADETAKIQNVLK